VYVAPTAEVWRGNNAPPLPVDKSRLIPPDLCC
jgi:hypothetical protein